MSRSLRTGLLFAAICGVPVVALPDPYGVSTGLFLLGAFSLAVSLRGPKRSNQILLGSGIFVICCACSLLYLNGMDPISAPGIWLALLGGFFAILALSRYLKSKGVGFS